MNNRDYFSNVGTYFDEVVSNNNGRQTSKYKPKAPIHTKERALTSSVLTTLIISIAVIAFIALMARLEFTTVEMTFEDGTKVVAKGPQNAIPKILETIEKTSK